MENPLGFLIVILAVAVGVMFYSLFLQKAAAARQAKNMHFGSVLLASTSFTFAGTWSDDFSGSVLGSDWSGDRGYCFIRDGALDGISAEPIVPVPLHQVELGTNWGDWAAFPRPPVQSGHFEAFGRHHTCPKLILA
jgi:hypothetical protein